jgi:hypothetical protein
MVTSKVSCSFLKVSGAARLALNQQPAAVFSTAG